MGKLSKFLNHYRDGGFPQAGKITWRYYRNRTARWIRKILPKNINRYGWRHGIPFIIAEGVFKLLPENNTGTNIFEYDWDMLIVLDTCRPEWVKTVSSEFEFIGNVETIRSVGGRTSEWAAKTFQQAASSERPVKYIYGSKYGDIAEDLQNVETEFVNPDNYIYPPAHQITEATYRYLNLETNPRVVVHYAQPHFPIFRTLSDRTDVETISKSGVVKEHLSGTSTNKIERLHIKNLRYVLFEIRYLIQQVGSSDILLTADHGQLLGEYGIVGHPYGVRHDSVRNVPLVWIDRSESSDVV